MRMVFLFVLPVVVCCETCFLSGSHAKKLQGIPLLLDSILRLDNVGWYIGFAATWLQSLFSMMRSLSKRSALGMFMEFWNSRIPGICCLGLLAAACSINFESRFLVLSNFSEGKILIQCIPAAQETVWGTWPTDELSLAINESTFDKLRPLGSFDVWIAEAQPPTGRMGQNELLQQLAYFNVPLPHSGFGGFLAVGDVSVLQPQMASASCASLFSPNHTAFLGILRPPMQPRSLESSRLLGPWVRGSGSNLGVEPATQWPVSFFFLGFLDVNCRPGGLGVDPYPS